LVQKLTHFRSNSRPLLALTLALFVGAVLFFANPREPGAENIDVANVQASIDPFDPTGSRSVATFFTRLLIGGVGAPGDLSEEHLHAILSQADRYLEIYQEDKPNHALLLETLSSINALVGNMQAAIAALEQASSINSEVYGESSPVYFLSRLRLAKLYWKSGNPGHAEMLYHALSEVAERLEFPPRSFAAIYAGLCNTRWMRGDLDAAVINCEKALKIRQQELDPMHLLVARSTENLAIIYTELDRYSEAIDLYETAFQLKTHVHGEISYPVALNLTNHSSLLIKNDEIQAAQDKLNASLAIFKQLPITFGPGPGIAYINLSEIFRLNGNFEEAERYARLAIEELVIVAENVPNHHLASGYLNLAEINLERNENQEGLMNLKASVSNFTQTLGLEHPETQNAMAKLASVESRDYEVLP
jgi:tetratricopeptide (TPR) repeat protein